MTTPATTRRAGPFIGNGTQTAFPFAFRVFSAADIKVLLAGAGGVEAEVPTSGYSVTINEDQDATPGGTVNTVTAPAAGESLAIVGGTPYSQTLDLPNGGAFSPRAVENAFDRTVFQIQQLAEASSRALSLPATATGTSTRLPAPAAGNVIGWDDTASGLRNFSPEVFASVVAYANRRTLVADGGLSSYTLAADPGNASNTLVAVGGAVQTPGVDYTVSGTTLTPTTVWPAGTGNVVIVYGEALPVGTQNADSVNVTQAGTGALTRDAQSKLREYPDATDYSTFTGYIAANPVRGLWTGQGARPQRITDRLMVGSATRNDGAQSPATFDWPNDPALRDGIYQYIPNNAVVSAGAFGTGLALAGWARTSTGAGGGGEAALGVTGFAYNDYEMTNRGALTVTAGVPSPIIVSSVGVQGDFYTVTSGGALSTPINGITSLTTGQQIRFHNGTWRVGSVGPGAWALYGTALRRSSKIVGFTHALELDIANAGDDVDLAPANMFAAGGTHAAWIGAGGEAAQHGGPALNRVSAAIGIIANDPTTAGLTAGSRFLAGIVFQNLSLYGCDGSTGEADWLRVSPGHRMTVLNNSGAVVSRLLTTNTNPAKAQRMDFSAFGLLVRDDATGKTHLQVEHIASAVNYITIKPNTTGQGPEIVAAGDNANVNLVLRAKGTANIALFTDSQTTVGAAGGASTLPATPVGYMKLIVNGTLRAVPFYNA